MTLVSSKTAIDRFASASHSLAITLVLLAAFLLVGHVAGAALAPTPPILVPTISAWLLLLAGLSLWLRSAFTGRWWHMCSVLLAVSMSTIALLACLGYLRPSWPWLDGVDRVWRVVAALSPQAAAAFLLGGLGLLSLDWERWRGGWPSQALALSVVGIAFPTLLGHLYDVPSLYTISAYPPVQVHESVALLLFGFAVLFARPDGGLMRLATSSTSGGVLARSVPVAVVAVPMILGWVALSGERSGWWDPAAGTSMFVFANIVFFSLLVFRVARSLDRTDTERALSEEKFSRMFRSSPDAMVVRRISDGRILEVNDGFSQITGFQPGEVIGSDAPQLDLGIEPPVSTELPDNAVTTVRNAQVRFRTKSGEERQGLCSTEVVNFGGEQCLLTVTRDVSDRQHAQEALQEANEKLARWVSDLEARSREISLLNDMSGVLQSCVTADEACATAVQFGQQLLPRSAGAIYRFADVGGVLETAAVWGNLLPVGEFTPLECWALRRGRPYVVGDSNAGIACAHVQELEKSPYVCVPMMAQGEALGILHVRDAEDPAIRDATTVRSLDSTLRVVEALAAHVSLALANLRLRERLRHQSVRDELTGLFNRRYMEESLERELFRARRLSGTVSLALLDLDGFKSINDARGHDAGDELLKAMSQIFRSFLRAGDVVCRYGGDEFLFVMPGMGLSAAFDRVGEICDAVKSAAVWHRGRALPRVSASAGVVVFPDHGDNTALLLSAADTAMYRAKTRGGNSVEAASSAVVVSLPQAG